MFKSKPQYTRLGFLPEAGHVLLRDNKEGTLELWRPTSGATVQTVIIERTELEFVRFTDYACRVPDTDYNRAHAPHEIGRIYIDSRPIGVEVQEL